jgi:hypothetical protein
VRAAIATAFLPPTLMPRRNAAYVVEAATGIRE